MRFQLFLLFILFSITSTFACVCDPPPITEKYMHSDFVAKIKVVRNYKSEGEEELYKADVIIKELYKGESLKSIYIEGRNTDSELDIGSSCAIFIEEGTELIAYGRKDKKGRVTIGMCSGLLYLTGQYKEDGTREIMFLRILKNANINYTNDISIRPKGGFLELKEFSGIELKKDFAIYEITFSSNMRVKNVREISGFGNRVDVKLFEIVKNSEWQPDKDTELSDILENCKVLFGIYYYPKEKKYKSFLSRFYL